MADIKNKKSETNVWQSGLSGPTAIFGFFKRLPFHVFLANSCETWFTANFGMLFLVIKFISLVDKMKLILISSLDKCMSGCVFCLSRESEALYSSYAIAFVEFPFLFSAVKSISCE